MLQHVPSSDSVERNQQIEEARRLAAAEGSLVTRRPQISVRPGHERAARPAAFKKDTSAPVKGHEAFLKALETSGATIRVEKCDGTIVEGTVKHSDKYTISLRQPGPDRVIFKHDISEFSPVTPRQPSPDAKAAEGIR